MSRLIADMGDYYANVSNIMEVPDDMDVKQIIHEWQDWYDTSYVTGKDPVYKSWLDWVEERGGKRPRIEGYP